MSTTLYDRDFLQRLNRLSLTRSFTPQTDVDWNAATTDEEYDSLYPVWSLFVGSGLDTHLDAAARVRFVKYQQMNLMLFTGLLERHAIGELARLYDLDARGEFSEYVGHFIKEEIYHHELFRRAAAKILDSMPGAPPIPTRAIDRSLRQLFGTLGFVPFRRLRITLTFTLFQFAERVTIQAHRMVSERIGRREGFVNQVWAFHVLDEARHVAFDNLVLERNRLPWGTRWLTRAIAGLLGVWLSLLLNANEVWIGRQVGIPARLWMLPRLMRGTQAAFKHRVFGLLKAALAGRLIEDKEDLS
jgi:hypothetical protein